MDKTVNFLNQIPGWLQKVGIPIAVIMIAAAAILMMTGQQGGARAKQMLGYVLIGLAVLFLAASIVSTVQSALQ